MNREMTLNNINAALKAAGSEFFASWPADDKPLVLVDIEGEVATSIDTKLYRDIAHLGELTLGTLIDTLGKTAVRNFAKGFRHGKRAGRAEIVNTVQELLGIDRLTSVLSESMAELRDATYHTAGKS